MKRSVHLEKSATSIFVVYTCGEFYLTIGRYPLEQEENAEYSGKSTAAFRFAEYQGFQSPIG